MAEPVAAFPAGVPGPPGVDMVRIDDRGGAVVVTVCGRIDAGSAPQMRDVLAWAVSCHEHVVVDLSGAGHIDRAGLNVLIAAQDRAVSQTVRLRFTAPSPLLLSSLCELRATEVLTGAVAPSRPVLQPGGGIGFSLPRPAARLGFLPQTTG